MNPETAQNLIKVLTITPKEIRSFNQEKLRGHILFLQLCLIGIVGHACDELDIPNRKRHFTQATSIINHLLIALDCLHPDNHNFSTAGAGVLGQGVAPEFQRTE